MKEIERCPEGCLEKVQMNERPLSDVSPPLRSAVRLFVAPLSAFCVFYDAFLVV